jgi:hypothetical protein
VFRIVDGDIYAQPLIVTGARIVSNGRSSSDLAIVATEHNSVYAFDAEDTNQLSTTAEIWHTGEDVLGTHLGYLEVYKRILGSNESCTDMTTEIGITSTPVIAITKQTRPKEGVVFVVAKSKTGNTQVYKLFGLNLADGKPLGVGVSIQGEVAGNGFGAIGSGAAAKIRFDPVVELNRPALLLQNNILYVAFGGACDRPLGNLCTSVSVLV